MSEYEKRRRTSGDTLLDPNPTYIRLSKLSKTPPTLDEVRAARVERREDEVRYFTMALSVFEQGRMRGMFSDAQYRAHGLEVENDYSQPTERQSTVPTWLDPEIFVRMALRDPEVLAAIRQRNNRSVARELQRVLSTEYMKYVRKQFEVVSTALGEWLIMCHLWEQDRDSPSRSTKLKISGKKKVPRISAKVPLLRLKKRK